MKILALDQASRISGYSVFDGKELIASGTIPLADDAIGERLVCLRQHVKYLWQQYDIDYILLEDIQLQQGKQPQTYKVLGEVLGVLEELATELVGTNYEIISSNTWKSGLSIKGKTRSEQKHNAQAYVQEHFNKKVTQDESDAICIGAYFTNRDVGFNWDD